MSPASSTSRLTRGLPGSIPVHPRVFGSFAPGYQIASIVAEPSTITVGGPQKRVEGDGGRHY